MKFCIASSDLFSVSPEEQKFLEDIAPVFQGKKYALPLPTCSPKERLRQRVAHRNEQFFHKITSALSGGKIVALYHPDAPVPIYSIEEWFGDGWDALEYGRDFDFGRPFFEQFQELSQAVPKPNLTQIENENSPYTTGTGYCTNCAYINSSEYCRDCLYGKLLQHCQNVVDSAYAYDSEFLYECFNVSKCAYCVHVYNSEQVKDCSFSENLQHCEHCFLCTDLQGKKYHFMNESLAKEEYEKTIQEFSGYDGMQKALKQFQKLRTLQIRKYANIVHSSDCSGDFIRDSKHCYDCYDMNESENCRLVQVGVQGKNLLDCSNVYVMTTNCYQMMSTIDAYECLFSMHIFHCHDVLYSEHCHHSEWLFGCSGLKNQKYCILNKKYSKSEYEKLIPKIIEHLQKTNEWGQFFPIQSSLFPYNETLAYEYLPLGKTEVLSRGWKWSEEGEEGKMAASKKIEAKNLPRNIGEVTDDILESGVICAESGKLFRIQKEELDFYRTLNLPIPHLHPQVRHSRRMGLRNPRKLWAAHCGKCKREIETTYPADGGEVVYCEECYLESVH